MGYTDDKGDGKVIMLPGVRRSTDLDPTIQGGEADTIKPTRLTANELQRAYDHFNTALFGGELPDCVITLQRNRGAYGYFSPSRFDDREGNEADEIALNPTYVRTRPIEEVLSTLVHEEVHLWQHHYGKPGRGPYHNKEWAMKMIEIGLRPMAFDGGMTGDRVSHSIIAGGRFDIACRLLLGQGFQITWQDVEFRGGESGNSDVGNGGDGENAASKQLLRRGRSKRSKTRFVCKSCQFKAWAKETGKLICGYCEVPMFPG